MFPNLGRFIWIRREDTTKQAVSLWKALQTWNWRQDGDAHEHELELRYSLPAIAHLKLRIDEHNAAWEDFFRGCGIEPVRVVYEGFVKSYEETVLNLLTEIGTEVPDAFTVKPPTMKRQADAVSSAWVARFRREQEENAPYASAND